MPTRAIQTEATEQRVYRLLPGDTVQRIVIRPGETLGEYTEIDPVLQTGDPVVLDPPPGLMDGALVRTPKP